MAAYACNLNIEYSNCGELMATMFRGFYPPIHDRDLEPRTWLAGYDRTYVERDVRSLINFGDLGTFRTFLRLCAGRVGQLLNMSSLASDCGVSHTTVRRWLSILEASFLVVRLRPHHRNFNKRLIKSPELYFLDTGLLCYMLGVESSDHLALHSNRGAVFESFIVAELLKNGYNQGVEPILYFWRDAKGHEIDLVVEAGNRTLAIELKSGQTVAPGFLGGLHYWRGLVDDDRAPAALIYGGDRSYCRSGITLSSWRVL